MPIQVAVNLAGGLGGARSQGARSTCMAFAMSDLNRMASGAPGVLSAEFLYQSAGAITPGWQMGMGLYSTQAMMIAKSPGQPLEVDFPYQTQEIQVVDAPSPPAGKALYSSDLASSVHVMQVVIDKLNSAKPVGLVIRVTPGFQRPTQGVVAHGRDAYPNAFHAVIAVGWGVHEVTSERHLLIRNSWGEGWGLSGHAWLPEEFVDLHVLEAFGG
jgi:hypothetical protein